MAMMLEKLASTRSLAERRSGVIFPTNSPVDALSGSSDVDDPAELSAEEFKRSMTNLCARVMPLLEAREVADKVFSGGYFERHYPKADSLLKDLLHKKAMLAWSRAANDSIQERVEPTPKSNIQITVSLGA